MTEGFDDDRYDEPVETRRGCGGCLLAFLAFLAGVAVGGVALFLALTSPTAVKQAERLGIVKPIRDNLAKTAPDPLTASAVPASPSEPAAVTGTEPRRCSREGVDVTWQVRAPQGGGPPIVACRVVNGAGRTLRGLVLEVSAPTPDGVFVEYVDAVTADGPAFRGPLSPEKAREVAFPLGRAPAPTPPAAVVVTIRSAVFAETGRGRASGGPARPAP
ncbi:MAG: hypothetical protein KA419_13165 [Acidobacteria bacterium]|nr:hypothetical protein [Acidobacteriota bacterium]